MANAKIINYGQPIGAGSTAIPDNTTVALDIESTDAKAYVTIDTSDGSEKLVFNSGQPGIAAQVGVSSRGPRISGTTGASYPAYNFIGDEDTGMTHLGTSNDDQLSLIAGGVEGIRIVEDATCKVTVGAGTAPAHTLHVQDGDLGIVKNQASADSGRLVFTKSRDGTDGGHSSGAQADDDAHGEILFQASDGDQFINTGSIMVRSYGASSNNSVPSEMIFRVNASAADLPSLSSSDNLYLRSSGNFGVGDSHPNSKMVVGGGKSTPIQYIYNTNTSAIGTTYTSIPNGAAAAIFDHRVGESIYCINTTSENTAGGRETGIGFFGKVDLSTDEYHYTSAIRSQHEGTGADQKGYMTFLTNDGDDNRAIQERMRIDSAGNVGIGAIPTDYWANADDLVVSGGASTGITVVAATTGTLSFATGTSGAATYQNVIQGTGSASGDGIRFITNGTSTECIRITTAGDILCPQLDASADVQTDGSKNLTTSSDMRLKNPIAVLEDGLDKINQLVPRFFSWKNDEDNKSQLGFFSQEVHGICPEAAPKSPKMVIPESGVDEDGVNACDKETSQALDDDGNLDFNWSLNSRAIVALLVKSVQELSAKVTALEEAQGN